MDDQLPSMPKAFAYATECINPGIGIPHSVSLFWPDQFTGKTEPIDRGHHGIEYLRELVTMEQLRDYAAEAVRIERERCAQVAEDADIKDFVYAGVRYDDASGLRTTIIEGIRNPQEKTDA